MLRNFLTLLDKVLCGLSQGQRGVQIQCLSKPVEEFLDQLGTACFFTTQDLTESYWQIPLLLESREKTTSSTLYTLYQFVTLWIGLFGAPATFQ